MIEYSKYYQILETGLIVFTSRSKGFAGGYRLRHGDGHYWIFYGNNYCLQERNPYVGQEGVNRLFEGFISIYDLKP